MTLLRSRRLKYIVQQLVDMDRQTLRSISIIIIKKKKEI